MSAETYVETWSWGGLAGRFATIDYADSLGGYEWDEFHVMRGADGYLYVGEDGGCSCNSFSDTDVSAFERVASWQDAATKAQEWANGATYDPERRMTVAMNLIERLTKTMPLPYLPQDARKPFDGAA